MPSRKIQPALRTATRLLLLSGLCLLPCTLLADVSSDSLIVISTDGRQYTAQHTLATDGELVTMTLPRGRITLKLQFNGPDKQTYTKELENEPNTLSIQSGSVLARYRHPYADATSLLDDGTFEWYLEGDHALVSAGQDAQLSVTTTWVLPDNARLISFNATDANGNALGLWQTSGNTVTYNRNSVPPKMVSLQFDLQGTDASGDNPCLRDNNELDKCAPDIDGDNVPDNRDICLPEKPNAHLVNLHEEEDPLGCDKQVLITLNGVQFESGQSYLDAASRQVLDRVALALKKLPAQLFEVRSHTDNAGRVSHNQRLSENRADAVRHYLMLRGVGPNQLRASGYGETSPKHDNRKASGRRANRRIELRRLN